MPIFTKDGLSPVFYAHVPKTGGSYIEHLFLRNEYSVYFLLGGPREKGLVISPQHYHREIFEKIVRLDRFECKFMTVRHPVSRLISEFTMRHEDNDRFPPWIDFIKRRLSFDEYALDNHLRPQVDFYHPSLRVYRQEDGFDAAWSRALDEEYSLAFTVFQIKKKRVSSAVREPLAPKHLDLAVECARTLFQEDFEFFGYPLLPDDV